jgi:hypothetical protein
MAVERTEGCRGKRAAEITFTRFDLCITGVLHNVSLFRKTFCFTILQFHETFISLVSGKTDRELNKTFYETAALFACFAFRETEIDQFGKNPYLVA